MAGDKDFIYDEDESVKFIQNYLPQELKGKFNDISLSGVGMADVGAVSASDNASQAVSALVALGYSQSRAAMAVAGLDGRQDVQSLIKQGLKLLAGGKI